MHSGKLDRSIVLQRASITINAFNEQISTWATLATVWASYSPISDAEKARASETTSDIVARFQIRWSATVASLDSRDQVVFDGRTWDITGVKGLSRREGLEITAAARGERI
jgi:SPP1 family predicted phage head-tail adaptor